MTTVVGQLCERLSTALSSDAPQPDLIRRWIDDPIPLPPWDVWTLVCLVRHRVRQNFVGDTIQRHLNADLEAIATAGAFAHPPVPQNGLVPDLTDWEYYFHGKGCCLTHRVTGEAIDVDFYDATSDWFDDFFYVGYLKSLRDPEFAEERLIQLHPSKSTVVLELDELVRVGLLERHPESKVVRIGFDDGILGALLDQAEQSWADELTRILIAAALGDWLCVADEAGEQLRESAITQAERCRRERTQRLAGLYDSDVRQAMALQALGDLNSPLLAEYLKRSLAGPPTGTTSTALDIIAQLNDTAWCEPVHQLMKRVDPNGAIPKPVTWLRCAEFLLRHRFRSDDIRRQLPRAHSLSLAEAALLAMEYAPEQALKMLRSSLRSRIPNNRLIAAAVLAIIDQPWSRQELTAVLQESDDQMMTAECRSALLESHSDESHRIVCEWEERNPHEPKTGEFISMDEMMLRGREDAMRYEMQKWHDRAMPLRSVELPEPQRRWWEFWK